MSNIPYYVPTYVFPGESRALRVSSLKVSKDDKGGVWPVEFYDKGGVWTVEFYEKPTPDPWPIRGGVPTKGCNIAMAEGEAEAVAASIALSDFIHSNEALVVRQNAGT